MLRTYYVPHSEFHVYELIEPPNSQVSLDLSLPLLCLSYPSRTMAGFIYSTDTW